MFWSFTHTDIKSEVTCGDIHGNIKLQKSRNFTNIIATRKYKTKF